MTNILKVIKKNKPFKEIVDFSLYINKDTGESLEDEMKDLNIKSNVTEISLDKRIESDNYMVFDSKALVYLYSVVNKSTLGSILMLTALLKTNANIIYNNNIPHTNKSLQRYLGITSEAMYFKLIKDLEDKKIIYKTKSKVIGRVMTIYIFNPFIARKRHTIDKEILSLFSDETQLMNSLFPSSSRIQQQIKK